MGDSDIRSADAKRSSGELHNDAKISRGNSSIASTLVPKRTKADDETRRYQRWLSFARPRVVLGFDRLAFANTPLMDAKARGIALCFSRIQGWSLPAALLRELESGEHYINLRLSLSLCHLNSNTFFGTTWLGSGANIGEGIRDKVPEVVDIDYSEIVYLLSRLADASCVAIVEIVASKMLRSKRVSVSQHGCGWAMIPLFAQPFPSDVEDGFEVAPEMTSTLLAGSPRDLMLKPSANLESKLKELKGTSLHYRLFTHRKLLRAQELIPENAIVGRHDVVAGLVPRSVTLENSLSPEEVACIGDSQTVLSDKRNKVIVMVPTAPKVCRPMTLRVTDWHILIPKRLELEAKLRTSMARSLAGKEGAAEFKIVSRLLKIGVHNGHCVVGGEWITCPLLEEAEDDEVLLTDRKTIDIPSYVPHSNSALVFMLEYEVGLPSVRDTALDVQKTLETTMRNGRLVSCVTIGASAYVPCTASNKLVLRNTGKVGTNAEELDIELNLRDDDLCSVLSPNPIFRWQSLARDADGKEESANIESTPVMGFDLAAFDAAQVPVDDGYVLQASDIAPSKDGEKVVRRDVDDDLLSGERKRTFSDAGLDREAKAPPSSPKRPSYRPSAIRKDATVTAVAAGDNDDLESLPDSIVGGNEDHSMLRLDRSFYMNDRESEYPRVREFDVAGLGSQRSMPRRGDVNLFANKDRGSLLNRSLQAPLHSDDRPGKPLVAPPKQRAFEQAPGYPMEDDVGPVVAGGLHRAVTTHPNTSYPRFVSSDSAHVRDLTRGSRSRLSRHGIDLSGGEALSGPSSGIPISKPQSRLLGNKSSAVDLDLEACDHLALSEVSFMFAGFRPLTPVATGIAVSEPNKSSSVKSVYFTFQFYTCAETKTEAHRLLPADPGAMHVLCRDESHSRENPPVAYRFFIDCSNSSPMEAIEFAQYLSSGTLQIDIWDAESLLLIGSSRFPLRRLLRQGQGSSRAALECDVIDPLFDASTTGGVASMTVMDNGGPVAGAVVGSINVIAENIGREGKFPTSAYVRYKEALKSGEAKPTSESRNERENVNELNWRALGADGGRGVNNKSGRPRHIVRARPLAESTPELSKVLSEQHRISGGSGTASFRSLSSVRGAVGSHTLTYDDVVLLFKRFQGNSKGTIQYEGNLMSLLDVPSWKVILRKLLDAYSKAVDNGDNVEAILRTYTGAMGDLSPDNLREFLNAFLTKSGVSYKPEEVSVLVNKFSVDNKSAVRVSDVMAFCNTEYERLQWTVVGKRFRNVAQKAAITGADVEQMLSDRDKEGDGYVTTRDFKSFLEKLAEFGRLRLQDINMICKYFARRPAENEPMREPVSIKEVMAFLGKEYVGNLNLRLRDAIIYTRVDGSGGDKSKAPRSINDIVRTFRKYVSGASDMSRAAVTADVESALRDLDVYGSLSHDQVRAVVNKAFNLAVESGSRPSFGALLRFVGIDFSDDSRSSDNADSRGPSSQVITAEYLIRQILELTTKSGVAVDEAFRHFDSDGNGSISPDEFIQALDELHIFSNIDNWREQIGSIVGKFDTTGDGSISLIEFFHMLGAQMDYSPNIVQRMTKIFAVAVDNGMNFESIFADFDKDGDGKVTVQELYECLKTLGTFNEISQADASKALSLFDKSGTGTISLDEFKDFFAKRVQHAQLERRERLNRRSVRQFIDLMAAAMDKGLTAAQVFKHFDKDGTGKVSADELTTGLRDLPQFKSLTSNEVSAIVGAIDSGNKKDITKDQFEAFIATQVKRLDRGAPEPSGPEPSVTEKFMLLMSAAMNKGLTAAKLFRHFDKDDTGTITVRELSEGLKGLPQFKSLSDADLTTLINAIDKNRSGSISLNEFEKFVVKGSAQMNSEFVDRVHKTFRKVISKGISIDQLFAHIDKDKSGCASAREIEDAFLKTSAFKELKPDEIERLIGMMDYNGDGMISVGEFKQFVESGEITAKARPVSSSHKGAASESTTGELLLRHLRRISEPDGGIAGLLAYLDRDEDGEISVLSFMKMLRREGVLNSMDERDILNFIKPALSKSVARPDRQGAKGVVDAKGTSESKRDDRDRSADSGRNDRDRSVAESKSSDADDERIRIVPLLHLLDGSTSDSTNKISSAKKDLEEDELVERSLPEYSFSNDPEIRTIEKKLRNVGHTLARRGFDIETLFRKFDASNAGSIRRTDFLEVLSQMGLYILEQGKSLEAASGANDLQSQQERQVARIRGSGASANQSLASARKYVNAFGDVEKAANVADFQDHLESMTLVNWYRQSQKRILIQRVLSHSLESAEKIFPRFGKTLFFEYPITNPFGHEERFIIEVNDPELRVVVNFDEWMYLRSSVRPCVGKLGDDPLEPEMFDRDGNGRVQVSLLPQETLWIPFTFMTLAPYTPPERFEWAGKRRIGGRSKDEESKSAEQRESDVDAADGSPNRSVPIRMISGTHGHVISTIRLDVFHRPFVVDRVFRFFEPDNSVMKRRIQLIGCRDAVMYPGEAVASSKYVHCVETGPQADCRVVVEWGPSGAASYNGSAMASSPGLDVLIRYRCGTFPAAGQFYLLVYNDPYQSVLHEVWNVVINTRQRLDVNATVGSSAPLDLVVRGDRIQRRARAYASKTSDCVVFDPSTTFQMAPSAYNRVMLKYSPTAAGSRNILVNLVDTESRELVSAWVLIAHCKAPEVLRHYDVTAVMGAPQNKKIVFQNPWDVPRRFTLTSSNEALMKPRTEVLEVGPQGSTYMRLWFAGATAPFDGPLDVFLFLNDESGRSEESFLFRIHSP